MVAISSKDSNNIAVQVTINEEPYMNNYNTQTSKVIVQIGITR